MRKVLIIGVGRGIGHQLCKAALFEGSGYLASRQKFGHEKVRKIYPMGR